MRWRRYECQHDEKAFTGKLLGNGATDAPAHTHGHVAVIDRLTMRKFGVTAI